MDLLPSSHDGWRSRAPVFETASAVLIVLNLDALQRGTAPRLRRVRPSDRPEFVREGTAGDEEPRRGEGYPGASAGALASNPLPWWEKLAMDVSL